MNDSTFSRREALGLASAMLAGCAVRSEPVASSAMGAEGGIAPAPEAAATTATSPTDPDRRIRPAPGDELVNTFEFEQQAQLALPPDLFERIAGGDREPFNRLTLRPRMNVPTLDMDLGIELWGQTLFTPIVIGPIAGLGLYHPEGERALIRGAVEAYTGVIVSSRSSVPFEDLAEVEAVPRWYAVYAEEGAEEQARRATAAGAGAIFITVGLDPRAGRAGLPIDWRRVDAIRGGLSVPVVIKGVRTADEAATAVQRGVQGVVVSHHGGMSANGEVPPILALPEVAEAVGGRVPVLVDGGIRRGVDVLKALIMGADGVLMGRPAAWALAAYGSDGVRWLLELVHEELARNFGMLGVSRPDQLTRDHIRIHRWSTS